ncbi:MAG TPA: 1-deoxy-D-xylulose-5-phosphate reductoisomerase [Bacteroidales bacterium]|nr:1-deoxy-D-xylulose-5-phosphate reductoisomerase [Bacteroidales bacterium]HNR41052.1 1-deoxy-D-xylulose-5-phosphate reductoisomerase [Bacteroidales bacterium]HPM88418.1 1-deoxy-D-xylulose-5-phosphate reductoisomerase [Bacteroidales bacterium]HQG77171.1 1-deoxy-D-xylulose-5-phosphate reductoisomerase [Bacteroidales bacterium]
MSKRIALLGSTGSIGRQALDVISRFPADFEVEVLTAGNNIELLAQQARKFGPGSVVIGNKAHYARLKELVRDLPVKVYAGEDAVEKIAAESDSSLVLAAMVGYSGLKPIIAAIRAGKDIALANKETLVVAGEIIRKLSLDSGSRLIPVDSEHSAIFQCLAGETGNPVEKITLTASGGPFLNYSCEMLKQVKPSEALKHPKWDMGNKITVDSASLMNKGLEVIEAKWLFDLNPGQIEVLIHPQSIVHSMVHFADGSVKAQLGAPDMRIPILYALSYPSRYPSDLPKLDLKKNQTLTFLEPDVSRFRNLALAFEALGRGGNMPCIMNAANEVAVSAFLADRIGFLQMSDLVEYTMEQAEFVSSPGLELLEISNNRAREIALNFINGLNKKA